MLLLQANRLYSYLIGESIVEFRFFFRRKTEHFHSAGVNGARCPACPKVFNHLKLVVVGISMGLLLRVACEVAWVMCRAMRSGDLFLSRNGL